MSFSAPSVNMICSWFVLFGLVLAVHSQAPPRHSGGQRPNSEVAQIVKFDSLPNNGDGSYYFTYETSDAQRREERGEFKALNKDGEGVLTVRGTYSFVLPDGKVINVQYMADDKGYRQQVNDAGRPKQSGVSTRISSATLGSLVGGGLGEEYPARRTERRIFRNGRERQLRNKNRWGGGKNRQDNDLDQLWSF